jgi:hypothetical protein
MIVEAISVWKKSKGILEVDDVPEAAEKWRRKIMLGNF